MLLKHFTSQIIKGNRKVRRRRFLTVNINNITEGVRRDLKSLVIPRTTEEAYELVLQAIAKLKAPMPRY
jgi:hypothetical protein